MDFDSIPQSYEESKNDESNSNSDQIISSVLNSWNDSIFFDLISKQKKLYIAKTFINL